MLSFSHASLTWLFLHMAAVFAVSRTRPWFAAVGDLPSIRSVRRDGAGDSVTLSRVGTIFPPLPDRRAVRSNEPEVDWLHLAMHYRPVP
jgi:hypothetical protein